MLAVTDLMSTWPSGCAWMALSHYYSWHSSASRHDLCVSNSQQHSSVVKRQTTKRAVISFVSQQLSCLSGLMGVWNGLGTCATCSQACWALALTSSGVPTHSGVVCGRPASYAHTLQHGGGVSLCVWYLLGSGGYQVDGAMLCTV
jgi:hypothetical protein